MKFFDTILMIDENMGKVFKLHKNRIKCGYASSVCCHSICSDKKKAKDPTIFRFILMQPNDYRLFHHTIISPFQPECAPSEACSESGQDDVVAFLELLFVFPNANGYSGC